MKKRHLPKFTRAFTHPVFDYLLTLFDAMVLAISFNSFLLPNHIASGGVVGVSILIQYVFGFEPAYIQWMINIPLFIIGITFLGRKYGVRTGLGTLMLPLFIYLAKDSGPRCFHCKEKPSGNRRVDSINSWKA